MSADVEYFYACLPFPPRQTVYLNENVFNDELQWTVPGGLVYNEKYTVCLGEAMRKKYADGFNIGVFLGEEKKIFPRFKTTPTYHVTDYKAVNFVAP